MPVTIDYDSTGAHRLAAGTLTERQLTSAYNLAAFPRQADQPDQMDWFVPQEDSQRLSLYPVSVTAMDGSIGGTGGIEFSWFLLLTPLMNRYLRETVMGGRLSIAATVMTFDNSYGWRVVNCTMNWIDPAGGAEIAGDGYNKVQLKFVAGVLAQSGWEFNEDFNDDFAAPD